MHEEVHQGTGGKHHERLASLMVYGALSSSILWSSSCSRTASSSLKRPVTGGPFGAFSAFLVALFTEMYGFPLTIYFFSGWLQSHYPNIDWFSHDAGHLLEMMFGWKTNPHAGPFHILSFVFIAGGFFLISAALRTLYVAQQRGKLATEGAYAYLRHPQYVGLHPCDVRLPAAVADHIDARYVSRAGRNVRPSSAPGRT